MRKNLKTIVSDAAGIPKDVVLGIPLIRLIGKEEFYIENYRGILEYTDTCLRILTKLGQIYVTGRKLEIEYYSNDEMKIIGIFENICLKRGGA